MEFETVIGLEVHAQLKTRSKLFCGCAVRFAEEPNRDVCPVCLGLPGVLPVLNRAVIDLAIRLGLATRCDIRRKSRFARKNYFYPDLPKGYQISQFSQPICEGGFLEIDLGEGQTKRIGIERIHIEEDAGKLLHDETGAPLSRIDFNRGSVPLLEIVSRPELRTAEEAKAYLRRLRGILRYLGVSDADMEKGQMRCDINVSLRRPGQSAFGTRAEIKNVNSFRFVGLAILHEEKRQARILRHGGQVVQETRLFDSARGITLSMRSKEEAHDYRYFPDPDLVPLEISDEWLERVRDSLVELPDARKKRFVEEMGLSAYDAELLTRERDIADYYEAALAIHRSPKMVANWLLGELLRESKGEGGFDPPVEPRRLAELVALIEGGLISGKIARKVFGIMLTSDLGPRRIVEKEGLSAIADPNKLGPMVEELLESEARNVEQYLAGKTRMMGFFVGRIMKETGGRADPKLLNELLRKALSRRGDSAQGR